MNWEELYLANNPDVARAVEQGIYSSGREHFLERGRNEFRSFGDTPEGQYLTQNRDVANSVAQGAFGSGQEHYQQFGSNEGRSYGPPPQEQQQVPDLGGLLQMAMEFMQQSAQPIQAPTIQAQTIADRDLDPYLNPYTQNVIDTTLANLQEQNQITQNRNDAAAAAAGAFGGSRHGILGAETNRAFADQASDTSALLNQANQTNALNLAGADVSALNNINQFNAANAMDSSRFNSTMALNAGGALAGLAGQQFGMQNTANQNLAQDGLLQQQTMQALINATKGQFQGFTGSPQQSMNPQLAALGGIPGQGGTSTASQSPGLFNFLALAAS